jgi:hypothetical protein
MTQDLETENVELKKVLVDQWEILNAKIGDLMDTENDSLRGADPKYIVGRLDTLRGIRAWLEPRIRSILESPQE